MNTLELSERINAVREVKGRKPMQHGNLLLKCRKLFPNLSVKYYKAGKNREYPMYELTQDQILKIIYTESKEVSEVLVRELGVGGISCTSKGMKNILPTPPNKVSSEITRNFPGKQTITSLELLNQINLFRYLDGFSEMEHKTLLRTIRDEFEEEIDQHNFVPIFYSDKYGRKQTMFELTFDQARCILVRESKFVRKAIIKHLSRLEEENTMLLKANYEANKALLAKETEEADYYYELSENLRSQLKEAKKGKPVTITETKVPEDYEFLCGFFQMSTLTRQEATIPQVIRWYGRREYDPLELIRYSEIHMLPILQVDNGRGKLINSYHCKAWAEVYGVHFHD